MWFEIVPAFTIILAAMAAPHYIAYGVNYIFNGNFYRRSLDTYQERLQYLRDRRIAGGNGDPYKVMGLENIPDEEEHQCQCGCQGKKTEEEGEEGVEEGGTS